MNKKPFTPDQNAKVEKLNEASTAIREAIRALKDAKKSAEHWAEWETIGAFEYQLQEFMSCDHGEAGFQPYLENERKINLQQSKQVHYNQKGRGLKMTVPLD